MLALSAVPRQAVAQITSGSVTGSIRDGQGGVIPGAGVTLISAARGTSLEVTSNEHGDFAFPIVWAETYVLRVGLAGFKTLTRPGIIVHAGDRVSLGVLTIEVGEIAETVTVLADSPQLQLKTAERSFTVEGQAVQNIAVNGRGFLNLALLAPGVVSTAAPGTAPGAHTLSANGQRTNSNNVQIDGVTDMDTGNNGGPMVEVSLDSIQEVKVLTSNYQAEYGRSAGAQISAVTKSGGRAFHGSGYWFRRDDDLNANTWINNRNTPTTPVPPLDHRDLGYTIGGPVLLPGWNADRTKLFFFWSQEYQSRLNPQTTPVRVRVPTDLERQGDFSQTRDNAGNLFPFIRDYTTGLPCSASDPRGCFQDGGVLGRIPQNRLYGLGVNILNIYPTANSPGTTAQGFNYVTQVPTSQPARQDLLRMDWYPVAALRVTGKLLNNRRNYLNPYPLGPLASNLPDYAASSLSPARGYQFTGAMTLNKSTFLELTYGYSHNAIDIVPNVETPDMLTRATLGLTGFPTIYPGAVQRDFPPRFQFGVGRVANPPMLGTNNAPFTNFNTTQDVVGNLTKLWGQHTAKVGLYYHHSVKRQSSASAHNGDIVFNNDAANPFDTGFSFANAAIGVYTSFTQASAYNIGNFVYTNVEWFLQDNWKASRRLTLDYGLRFYWMQPQHETQGLAANFLPDRFDPGKAPRLYYPGRDAAGARVALDPTTGQTRPAVFIGRLVPNSGTLLNGVFPAGQGIEPTLYRNRGVHYAPRFGLTYDPAGTQKFIIRAGIGVFYDRTQGNTVFDLITNPPATIVPTLNHGRLQDIDASNLLLAPPALTAIDHEGKVPTTYAFNAGIQRNMPLGSVLDVSYVGSLGRQLFQRRNINAPDYGAAYRPENQDTTLAPSAIPGATALPVDFLRPYRGFANIFLFEPVARSNYHALQAGLNRRFKDGWLIGINYVLSKALGTVSTETPFLPIGAPRSDSHQHEANYGPLDFDRRHTFSTNFVYELPKVGRGGIVSGVLDGWQLSGVYRWQTGAPYTVTFTIPGISAYTLTGTQQIEGARIVITGDPGRGWSSDPYRQFNAAAFTTPQPGSIGLESGRNGMNRAPINNLDLSVAKRFGLGKRGRLELRLDAFNALNHTQFLDVNTILAVRSLTDPTPTNLPFDAAGNLVNQTGFGAITSVRPPRQVQLVARLQF